MSSLNQEQVGVTLALNSGALAIGSTTTQIAIATAVNYLFKGVFGQRATSASIAFPIEPGTGVVPTSPNSYQTLAAGQLCSFLIVIDPANANAVSGVQGPIVNVGEAAPVPAVPNNRVAIGALKVSNLTNPFIPGTTALSAAGVTTTYFNLGSHPGYSI